MDEADIAADRAEDERRRAIAAVQAVVAGEGQAACEDCPDEIEAARRKAVPSARRCVACQEAAERRARFTSGVYA